MFGEAFAAELGVEPGHSAASSMSAGINMHSINPNQWTVGADNDGPEYEETDDNIIFSKYVFHAVKRSFLSLGVFHHHEVELNEEDRDAKNFWVKFHKVSASESKLKKYVRKHVPATVRSRLWQEVSGGSSIMSKLPNLYHETCVKLFGKDNQLPENLPSSTLCNDNIFMSYYLTSEGVICLRRILVVLSHFHPDVTFCPILQQVAAIFLHFMEEVWCFACMTAMLSGRKMYFDQTHAQANATDSALHLCSVYTLKKETKRLHSFVLDRASNTEMNLFPDWLRMLFQYLDFTVLMRLVDCFVVEGPKVFFRTGLFLVRLFYEYTLDFERLGFPTAKDFVIALGQYSEALKIHADDFIKATLRIKLKNKQINNAIDKCLSGEKQQILQEDEHPKVARMISYDVRSISDIISQTQWECVINWLPVRIQLLKPQIAFTTDIDGFSLKTLYNKTENEDQTLLILKTEKGETFGGYLSMPLTDRKKGKRDLTFFGTGETFVFSLEPLLEKFIWTEIDQPDGKATTSHQNRTEKLNSFVFVDIKGAGHRKRRSFRMTKRKVSVKLQGIPKNFSFADLPSSTASPSYGGIRKNSSVIHLNKHAQKDEACSLGGGSSGHGSPLARLRDISAPSKDSPTKFPSVFGDSPLNDSPPKSETVDHSRLAYQHSMSEGRAGEYPSVNDDDMDGTNRVSQLTDDLLLVEKRVKWGRPIPLNRRRKMRNIFRMIFSLLVMIKALLLVEGGYAIWIDDGLYHGRSEVCYTFNNRVLTKVASGDFKITRLEIFCFRDADI
eukprot:gene5611-6301_t